MNLSAGVIAKFRLVIPSLEEQRAITTLLNADVTRLNVMHLEAERAITLLAERRAVLISAAVTGQIDVRGLAHAQAA